MNKLDIKLGTPFQVKSNLATYKEIDESGRTVKAVINTLNYYDYDQDVLRPGVAAKSIRERGAKTAAADKIIHALFHDLTRLPGKSTFEAETEIDGNIVLYAESELLETQEGEETLLKYMKGIYNQHSIGFSYKQIEWLEKDGEGWDAFLKDLINPEEAEKFGFGWDVKEIELFEWSTVSFGANKLTPFIGTKSDNVSVVYDSIVKKIDALIGKANRLDVKNKKVFDLQYKQLQQMLFELIQKPAGSDTLKGYFSTSTFDIDQELNNYKFKF